MSRYRTGVLLLAAVLALCGATGSAYAPQGSPPVSVHQPRGEDLLEDVLALMIAAARAEEQARTLEAELDQLQRELDELARLLSRTEERYHLARERTVVALRWLYRMGPTSYLEALLGAASLAELIQRVDLVVAATRGSMAALVDVAAEREALGDVRAARASAAQRQLQLTRQLQDVAEIGTLLGRAELKAAAELGTDWPRVRGRLQQQVDLWLSRGLDYVNGLPERFAAVVVKDADIDGVAIVPSLLWVTVQIPAQGLNDFISGRPGLEQMQFVVTPAAAWMVVAPLQLTITGTLSIDSQGLVTYLVDAVALDQLVVRDAYLDLDRLELDMRPALQGMRPVRLSLGHDMVEVVVSVFR